MENPFLIYSKIQEIQKMKQGTIGIADRNLEKIKIANKNEIENIDSDYFLFVNDRIKQKLLDMASTKKYKVIIGRELSNIEHFPASIEFFSFGKIENLVEEKKIKIEVVGFDDPLTNKSQQIVNKIKEEFGKLVSVSFIDLKQKNDYIEKYDIKGTPAIIIDGKLKFSGVPEEEKIRSDIKNRIKGMQVVPMQKTKKPQNEEGWKCPHCGAWNELEREICAKCKKKKPKNIKAPLPLQSISPPDRWWCPRCNTWNKSGERCTGCNRSVSEITDEEKDELYDKRQMFIVQLEGINSQGADIDTPSEVMDRLKSKKIENIRDIEEKLRSIGENIKSYRL